MAGNAQAPVWRPQVTVGDLDIAYLRSEEPVDGDTLVLIHGFGANKDNWTRLAKEFQGEFNISPSICRPWRQQ